jgi:hypothetical protein
VTPREKEFIEIKQELDLLRREVRRGGVSRDIGPGEARRRIHDYVSRGMPADMILRRLVVLGVPEGWVKDEIAEVLALYAKGKGSNHF